MLTVTDGPWTVLANPMEAIHSAESLEIRAERDKRLIEAGKFLDASLEHDAIDSFYIIFSKAVGKGWLEFLGEGKEYCNAANGRGQVTLMRSKPKKQEDTKDEDFATIRNESSYNAIAHLKQARRFEQMILRIGFIEKGRG